MTEIYRAAAHAGALTSIDAVAAELGITAQDAETAVRLLVDHGLLRPSADPAGGFEPVDPEVATASAVFSVEREIYQRREQIDQIRERFGAFREFSAERGPSPFVAIDRLTDPVQVRGLLKTATDACRVEVLVLLPNSATAAELERLVSGHLAGIARDIEVRVVCQHRSRTDLAARVKLKRLVDAGLSVRTVSHVPRAAAVFDCATAVLFGLAGDGDAVARVSDDGVVRFLLDLFNNLWDQGTPLTDDTIGYAPVADDLQRTIAALMAEGYTDEVIARKLDMSVRTCRRHIAALLRDLDAISRFQAGVLAARRYFAGGEADRLAR
ncbi:hypothetical protein ACTG9Q_12465 [Actinokineospora sp. 24-640]